MPETLLERHYRDRLESVRQLARPAAGHPAFSVRDFEDLVMICSELSVGWRQLLENEYARAFGEPDLPVTWLQERRKVIEELGDDYLQLVESIRPTVYQAWQAAGSPPGTDIVSRLDEASRAVVQAKQHVLECWPVDSDGKITKRHRGTILSEPILVADLPLPPEVVAMIAESHRSARLSRREQASQEEDVKLRHPYADHHVIAAVGRRGLEIHAIDLEDPDEIHELRQRLRAQGYRDVLSLYPIPVAGPNAQIRSLNPAF